MQNGKKKRNRTSLPITSFTNLGNDEVQIAARNLRFKHDVSMGVHSGALEQFPSYVQVLASEFLSSSDITRQVMNKSDEVRREARKIRFGMFN